MPFDPVEERVEWDIPSTNLRVVYQDTLQDGKEVRKIITVSFRKGGARRMRQLFVLGDSISIQYGPHLKGMVQEHFHYDRKRGEEQALVNLDQPVGANGGDSGRVLEYLTSEQKKGVRYDILLVNCGLHDMKTDPATGDKQVPADRYAANLENIVATARSMSSNLIWISTTDVIDDIHNSRSVSFHRFHRDVIQYNDIAGSIMSRYQVPVIDLYSSTRTFGATAYCDHVHFTEEVQRHQAAFIAEFLTEGSVELV